LANFLLDTQSLTSLENTMQVIHRIEPIKIKSAEKCQSCTYVLRSESSDTSLRCGFSYYQEKPALRKVMRLDRYFKVEANEGCYNWKQRSVSVLETYQKVKQGILPVMAMA
jgi:hypothetical protein